jgi:hypothetical protein
MRRRLLSGLFVSALGLCPVWGGCAEQADSGSLSSGDSNGAGTTASGSGGDQASAGSATAGKATGGGGASSTGGGGIGTVLPSAGTAPTAGSESVAGGSGGEPSVGGAGGEGGGPDLGCTVGPDCDDGNPCTTDACLLKHCSYSSNTTACADDKDRCTADICVVGVCTHPDNKTCACKTDAQCDDKDVCTDDHCDTTHQCSNMHNAAACGVGVPFTVDSFNSDADWTAAKTTPDQRAIGVTGADATNLEGNADLYVADSDAASIEFGIASLAGLGKLRVVIRSLQANTGAMVFLGVWNGVAWTDKPLGDYAAIPTGNYATIEVPSADFGQPLLNLTKLRLRFAATGGQKSWQIDEISAAK